MDITEQMLNWSEPFTDVGVDLDGVIYPVHDVFRKYCEKVKGMKNLPEITHWEFYTDWGLSLDEFLNFLYTATRYHNLFGSAEPMEGTLEGWELLKESGIKIHIMTSRISAGWLQTVKWLNQYNLIPDTLHFIDNKTILTKIASGRSIAIDDSDTLIKQMSNAGIQAVLRTQPWNIQNDTNQRVNSFLEFAQFIYINNNVK